MPEFNRDDEEDSENDRENLPALHESEKGESAVERLESTLRRLDGPLSASNVLVPMEAHDIGDTDERPNPRACDLGYPEGYELAVEEESGRVIFSDPPNWALAGDTHMHADEDDVIEDVADWA